MQGKTRITESHEDIDHYCRWVSTLGIFYNRIVVYWDFEFILHHLCDGLLCGHLVCDFSHKPMGWRDTCRPFVQEAIPIIRIDLPFAVSHRHLYQIEISIIIID